ncbi:MAG: hypothetical protein R3335_05940 [Anaerolineales bacterium]|nr:hypothetical protein [Anaerolineales bacterium]
MYHLATLFPRLRTVQIPLTRDQLMLIMTAINLIFLGIDIFLAHSISGTIVPNEWIPIIFGPVAGVILIIAGLIAQRNRPLATILANIVFVASILVGLLGAYFHLIRAILPSAAPGDIVSIELLVWAPPIVGPLMFVLVGLFGISAAWIEDPPDSGTLIFLQNRRLPLPLSKTRAYFFLVSLGTLFTVFSSVLDHARTDFSNVGVWIPTIAGIFGTVIAAALGFLPKPGRGELTVYFSAMLVLILTGVVGLFLHINENLIAEGTIVVERFLRGSPFLAPLLFANMGLIGLIVLMDPREV